MGTGISMPDRTSGSWQGVVSVRSHACSLFFSLEKRGLIARVIIFMQSNGVYVLHSSSVSHE
jgi:hypothetical protein